MSAGHRGLPAHARPLALLLPTLLAGLLLTAAPAAAAPVHPGDVVTASSVGLADEPVAVPAVVTVKGTSDAVGAVSLSIAVSAAGAPVTGGTVSVSENGELVQSDLALANGTATYSASGVSPLEH